MSWPVGRPPRRCEAWRHSRIYQRVLRLADRGSIRQLYEHVFVPRYTEEQAREAVKSSYSYAEALRMLGLRPSGGNHRLFRRYVDDLWEIPTEHFDPNRARRRGLRHRPIGLEKVLVEHSTYSRSGLKRRLFDQGLKTRRCEMCGQGEIWRGKHMSMLLDHINGVPDDNRFENLRIVCPNCAATLDTHCGRKNVLSAGLRACAGCGLEFSPHHNRQRYCSAACGCRHDNRRRGPWLAVRKVTRPSYETLLAELAESSYVAVGRKYGVSDNAVRKWVKRYKEDAG